MAGLLAETGLTLREDEVADLRTLAATDAGDARADAALGRGVLRRQRQRPHRRAAPRAARPARHVRRARRAPRDRRRRDDRGRSSGPRSSSARASTSLRPIIAEHFLPRARVLQARSALVALRRLAARLQATDPAHGRPRLDREAERIEAGAVEFAQLRAAHLVASGAVAVNEAERAELERLLLASSAAAALGLGASAPADEVRAAALAGVSRWRNRAGPLADPALVEVCETAARSCEAIYASTQ